MKAVRSGDGHRPGACLLYDCPRLWNSLLPDVKIAFPPFEHLEENENSFSIAGFSEHFRNVFAMQFYSGLWLLGIRVL